MKLKNSIDKLEIGNYVFEFRSSLFNKYKPYLDYAFHKITGETKTYWKIGSYTLIRKGDLKVRGDCFNTFFHLPEEKHIEIKNKCDEHRRNNHDRR